MSEVVREDVVKVTFDVDEQPLDKVDSGIDKLVQNTQKMAGSGGIGKLTQGFKSLADAAKKMANTKLTTMKKGLADMKTKLTEGEKGAKGLKNAVKNVAKASLNKLVSGLKKVGTGLTSALKTAGKLATKLASITVKGLATGVAALGTAAAAAGAGVFKLTEMASDLEETQNKVTVAFGDKAGADVQKWASNSVKEMGLAQQTALDMSALFGDMGTSMGLSQGEAANMSMSLTQLGADLASFKNMDIEETTTALNGIFTGETESLKRLGVVMTQTNLEQFAMAKGITKTMDEMTEAEKVQLRYQYVMEKTANAQGDFQRTGGGFANQLRMLKEQFKELGTNIGTSFIEPLTKCLQKLNGFATELNAVFKDGLQPEDMPKVGEILGRALTEGMNALQNMLPGLISFLSSMVGTLVQNLLPMIPQILVILVEGVTSIFSNLISIIQQNSGTIVNGVISLFMSVLNSLFTLLPQILSLGLQLVIEFTKGIAQNLPTILESAVQMINQLVDGILANIDGIIESGIQLVGALAQGLEQSLPKIISAAIRLIIGLVQSIMSHLPELIQSGIQLIMALANGLIAAIPDIAAAIPQVIFAIIQGLFSVNWLEVGWELIKGIFKGVWDGAVGLVSGLWDGIKGLFTGKAKETGEAGSQGLASGLESSSYMATNELTQFANTTSQYGSQAGTNLASGLSGSAGAITTAADTSLQGVPTAFQTNFTAATDATTTSLNETNVVVQNGMNSVVQTVNSTNLYDSGVQVMKGLVSGMKSQLPAVIAAAKEAAAAIKKATDVELDIHSPSRVMESSGENGGLGLAKGYEKTIPQVRAAAQSVSRVLPMDTYTPESGSTYSYGGDSTYTTISPQFNLTVSGTQDDRATARRIKRYVAQAITETFESMERQGRSYREA